MWDQVLLLELSGVGAVPEGKSIYERRTPGGQGNSLSTSKLPYRKCFSHILPADLIC